MLTSAALRAPSCRPHTLAGTRPCWCPLPLCQPLDGDSSPSFPVHDLCQHRQHKGWPPKDPRDAGHSLGSAGGRSSKGPRWPQLTQQCWTGTSSLIPSLEVIPSHSLPWGLWEKAWATGVPAGGESPALSAWPLQDMTSPCARQLGPRPTHCAGNVLPAAQTHRTGMQTGPRGAGPTASASAGAIPCGLRG